MKARFGIKIYWPLVTLLITLLPTLVLALPRWSVEIYSTNRKYIEVRVNTDEVPANVLLKDVGVLVTFYDRENRLLGQTTYKYTGPEIPFLRPKQTYVQWFLHSYDTAESVSGDNLFYPNPRPEGLQLRELPIKSSERIQKTPDHVIGALPPPLKDQYRDPQPRVRDHREAREPTEPPPLPKPENPGTRPGFTWVSGHWEWKAGRWEWKRGRWERMKSGHRWESGYWEKLGSRYVWVPGRWVEGSEQLSGVREVRLEKQESYHFLQGIRSKLQGGDFYFHIDDTGVAKFYANNRDQRGLLDLGDLGEILLDKVPVPETGYYQFGVPVIAGHTYIALARTGEEGHVIVFRVDRVTSDSVTLRYVYR